MDLVKELQQAQHDVVGVAAAAVSAAESASDGGSPAGTATEKQAQAVGRSTSSDAVRQVGGAGAPRRRRRAQSGRYA